MLLPFDPVIATNGFSASRANNSMSEMISSFFLQGVIVRDTGRSDDATHIPRQLVVAQPQFGVREYLLESIETRRFRARIVEDRVSIVALQVARNRQARCTEANDEILAICRRHCAHRIFRLASPIKTRMTVMIQNRTMTLGSAQPFSSK